MKLIGILLLVATAAAAQTNRIETIHLESQGLHCFDDDNYHLVLDKVEDGKTAAADIIDLQEIIKLKDKLLNKYRVKSGLSIAGGIMAVTGSALLLSGNPELEKWGAGVAVGGLVSISIGLAW